MIIEVDNLPAAASAEESDIGATAEYEVAAILPSGPY
jgi:hypothetical protein